MDPAHLRRLGDDLTASIGWPGAGWERVRFLDRPEPLATSMPIGQVASIALGAVGMTAASIAEHRGAVPGSVTVDPFAAALAMCANDFLQLDGRKMASWPELTGFYAAADGWVYLHAGFPPHTARLLAALEAPGDREGLAARVAGLTAQEVEDRCVASNTCGRRLRTPHEWQEHPACRAVAARRVIELDPAGRGPTRPWSHAARPLDGVRVLDLSRVLAGPTIGRTLAEHGAEVLRIASPNLPSIEPLVIDTGYGKRSAFVDLEAAEGRAALTALISQADVFVDGYRPGALARHGLDPDSLDRLSPGIVYLTLSAFGEDGPWGGLRGYDSLVQAEIRRGDCPASRSTIWRAISAPSPSCGR